MALMKFRLFAKTIQRLFFLMTVSLLPASAAAQQTIICNETGSDVELNFIFKRGLFLFSSEWEGWGPYPLADKACDSYFEADQYYEVLLNVQQAGFMGGMSDLNIPERGPSVRTNGGKATGANSYLCLNKVQNTTAYNEPIEFYTDCEREKLALFSVSMIRFSGESIELTLR